MTMDVLIVRNEEGRISEVFGTDQGELAETWRAYLNHRGGNWLVVPSRTEDQATAAAAQWSPILNQSATVR